MSVFEKHLSQPWDPLLELLEIEKEDISDVNHFIHDRKLRVGKGESRFLVWELKATIADHSDWILKMKLFLALILYWRIELLWVMHIGFEEIVYSDSPDELLSVSPPWEHVWVAKHILFNESLYREFLLKLQITY